MTKRIAIIGGGISGLSAAQRILERNAACARTDERQELVLFEAANRLGGVISTRHEQGFLVEESSDNFITTNPWAVELCEKLGLKSTLTGTDPTSRKTFVVHRGRLYPLPDGFLMMAPSRILSMAITPILSPFGKLRAALDYFLPRRRDESDESLEHFAVRRLGREVYERLIEPLVSSIYAADMAKLSINATLPQFREMEQEYGSLIRAMRAKGAARKRAERQVKHAMRLTAKQNSAPENSVAKASAKIDGEVSSADGPTAAATDGMKVTRDTGARYSLFMTPRDGLEMMVHAIRERLEAAPEATIRLETPVEWIESLSNGRYRVVWKNRIGTSSREPITSNESSGSGSSGPRVKDARAEETRTVEPNGLNAAEFDAVILAAPSYVSARLVRPIDTVMADTLAKIEHSGTVVLTVAYRTDQVKHPLNGAGVVVPSIEHCPILAISFSNRKYPHRAPQGTVLLRLFAGGAKHEHLFQLDDAALRREMLRSLKPLLKIEGEPIYHTIARWTNTMPQLHLGHQERIATIRERESQHPGLAIAGNYFEGVGIPHCVHNGWLAADRILSGELEQNKPGQDKHGKTDKVDKTDKTSERNTTQTGEGPREVSQ